jgi:hypothetical protein
VQDNAIEELHISYVHPSGDIKIHLHILFDGSLAQLRIPKWSSNFIAFILQKVKQIRKPSKIMNASGGWGSL